MRLALRFHFCISFAGRLCSTILSLYLHPHQDRWHTTSYYGHFTGNGSYDPCNAIFTTDYPRLDASYVKYSIRLKGKCSKMRSVINSQCILLFIGINIFVLSPAAPFFLAFLYVHLQLGFRITFLDDSFGCFGEAMLN